MSLVPMTPEEQIKYLAAVYQVQNSSQQAQQNYAGAYQSALQAHWHNTFTPPQSGQALPETVDAVYNKKFAFRMAVLAAYIKNDVRTILITAGCLSSSCFAITLFLLISGVGMSIFAKILVSSYLAICSCVTGVSLHRAYGRWVAALQRKD